MRTLTHDNLHILINRALYIQLELALYSFELITKDIPFDFHLFRINRASWFIYIYIIFFFPLFFYSLQGRGFMNLSNIGPGSKLTDVTRNMWSWLRFLPKP